MNRLFRILVTMTILWTLVISARRVQGDEPRWKVSIIGASGQVLTAPDLEKHNFSTADGTEFYDRIGGAFYDVVGGRRNLAGAYAFEDTLNIYSFQRPALRPGDIATVSGQSVAFRGNDTRSLAGQVAYRIRGHWWVSAGVTRNQGHEIQMNRAHDLLVISSVDQEDAFFYDTDTEELSMGFIWRTHATRRYQTQEDRVRLNSQSFTLDTSYQVDIYRGVSINPLIGVELTRATIHIKGINKVFGYDDPFVELSLPGVNIEEHHTAIGEPMTSEVRTAEYRFRPYFGLRGAVHNGRWELSAEARFTVGSITPLTIAHQSVFDRWVMSQSQKGFRYSAALSRTF